MNRNFKDSNNFANAQDQNLPLKSIHFSSIDSTHTWAKNHVEEWLTKGITVISADEQTKGRGCFKREWHSPKGVNLYLTFCFSFLCKEGNSGQLSQLLSLAVVALLERYNCRAKIKWPNDIFLNEKKIAGILCETFFLKELRGAICSVGLNVNMGQQETLKISQPATSLLIETKKNYILFDLQKELESYFISYLSVWQKEGFAPFFSLLSSYFLHQKGDLLIFKDHQLTTETRFQQLNFDGSIQLLLPNGLLKNFYSGEVIK